MEQEEERTHRGGQKVVLRGNDETPHAEMPFASIETMNSDAEADG